MDEFLADGALFPVFVALALIFTAFAFYFVQTIGRASKGLVRSKIFLNTDPIIKAFYLFFIGAAAAYILFLIYFLDTKMVGLFVMGEVTLGLALIGFSYMTLLLFLRKNK